MAIGRIWKSLDTTAKSFSYLWNSPVEWNHERRELIYNPISKKLMPWAISTIGSLTALILASILLLLALFGHVNLSFTQLLVTMALVTLYGFTVAAETAMLWFGEDATIGINFIMKLTRQLDQGKLL